MAIEIVTFPIKTMLMFYSCVNVYHFGYQIFSTSIFKSPKQHPPASISPPCPLPSWSVPPPAIHHRTPSRSRWGWAFGEPHVLWEDFYSKALLIQLILQFAVKKHYCKCLVISGWWFQPLWKIWVILSQLGWWHTQYMGKYKSCSSHHQPDILYYPLLLLLLITNWISDYWDTKSWDVPLMVHLAAHCLNGLPKKEYHHGCHLWTSTEVCGHLSKSMEIYGNLWKSVEIYSG